MLASEYSSIWVRISVLIEARQRAAQRADLGVGGPLGREPGRHALERRPDDDHLQDLVDRLPEDEDALAGRDAHQAFLLEPCQRLADRRAADLELLGQLPLVQPQLRPLGIDVHRRDALLEHVVDVPFEAEVLADGLDHEL